MEDDAYKSCETYGKPFTLMLQASGEPELAKFYDTSSEDYKRKFSQDYPFATDESLAALRVARANEVVNFERAMQTLDNAAHGEEYCLAAKLIFCNVLGQEWLDYDPMEETAEQAMIKGPKLSAVLKNVGLKNLKLGWAHVKTDYARLEESGLMQTEIMAGFAKQFEADKYVFSSIFWHNLRNVRGARVEQGNFVLCDQSFALSADPVFGGPGIIVDHAELGNLLSSRTRSDVTVLSGSYAEAHCVAYLLATNTIKFTAGKEVEITAIPSLKDANYSYFGQKLRQREGAALIRNFTEWSRKALPPLNLGSASMLPTYVHFVLRWAAEHDPKNLPDYAAIERYILGVYKPGVNERLGAWNKFADLNKLITAQRVRKGPYAGVGEACKALADRRDVQNKNSSYNRVFNTSDTSAGLQEPFAAEVAKHAAVLTAFLKDTDVSTVTNVDVCGYGDGAMMDPLLAKLPGRTFHKYDAKAKNEKREIIDWALPGKMPATAQMLYDVSYGEGTKIIETNAVKVARVVEAKYECGVVKFTLTKDSSIGQRSDGAVSLPYRIEELLRFYGDVGIVAPGKAHSPEIFVWFRNPRKDAYGAPKILPTVDKLLSGRLSSCVIAKAILMTMANQFRDQLWYGCWPFGVGAGLRAIIGPTWIDACEMVTYRSYIWADYEIDDVISVASSKKRAAVDDMFGVDLAQDYFAELAKARREAALDAQIFSGMTLDNAIDRLQTATLAHAAAEEEEEETPAPKTKKGRLASEMLETAYVNIANDTIMQLEGVTPTVIDSDAKQRDDAMEN